MLHLNRQRASESIPASPRELVRFGTHRSRNKNPDGVPGASAAPIGRQVAEE